MFSIIVSFIKVGGKYMELISLIIVGILFGFFKPSGNNKRNNGLNDIEKYKTFESFRKK